MVTIIPNRAQIEGKILSITKSDDIENFNILSIRASKIASVQREINLLPEHEAHEPIELYISQHVQKKNGIHKGSVISVMIRKTPKHLFVIPDSLKLL